MLRNGKPSIKINGTEWAIMLEEGEGGKPIPLLWHLSPVVTEWSDCGEARYVFIKEEVILRHEDLNPLWVEAITARINEYCRALEK